MPNAALKPVWMGYLTKPINAHELFVAIQQFNLEGTDLAVR
jgi:hypothetical protein